MNTISIDNLQKEQVIEFFKAHWGTPQIVISSGVYDCATLDGFAVLDEKHNIVGLITYVITQDECEIISLDSIEEGKGIGTSLIMAVENVSKMQNCKLVKLVTTNDNLLALKFYQKRGYLLSKLLNNAVAQARKVKPEIPRVGNDGIPVRDEIELKKLLN